MARPSNKKQRREQIVQALMVVMASKGYEGASIQAIAKQAGLAPGLIHYHFKTKQDILIEAVQHLSRILKQRFVQKSENASNPKQKLIAFIDSRLAKGSGADLQAVNSWVLIAAEAITQSEVRHVFVEVMRQQKQLLLNLLTEFYEGKKEPPEIDNKVAFIMAFMEGAFSLSVSATELMPQDWAAQEILNYLEIK